MKIKAIRAGHGQLVHSNTNKRIKQLQDPQDINHLQRILQRELLVITAQEVTKIVKLILKESKLNPTEILSMSNKLYHIMLKRITDKLKKIFKMKDKEVRNQSKDINKNIETLKKKMINILDKSQNKQIIILMKKETIKGNHIIKEINVRKIIKI